MSGVFTSHYDLGDLVYLITDEDKSTRMVTSIRFLLGGTVIYQLSAGATATDHYPEELRMSSPVESGG